jgi:SSS family solute:Na+ symporter
MGLSTADLSFFIGYICIMVGFGIWISRRNGGNQTTKDYFLASKSLPWWAVGGSLIASNISTEQILGMNGSGFAIGLAISAYELMAAITLIIVAKFFLPVFLKEGIYTMPQFLEKRYDGRVRTIMAFIWVALIIFINITSIFYLGGLAIESITGWPLMYGIIGLALYSATFSIFGGLKAVVWTDVVQVVVLVIGGLVASYMVVTFVGGGGYIAGLKQLFVEAPGKFDMIFDKASTYMDIQTGETKSSFDLLPGISVLIGGMWIANLYYWGNNQYIIQRALASKSLKEAQRGVAFAAILKIFMPLIVVIPGIAAYVILQDPIAYGFEGEGISKADEAFPWVLNNFVQDGLKGLVFAALVAAIGSSISSMVNSVSTMFTLDIYRPLFTNDSSNTEDLGDNKDLVKIGKITSAVCLVIGVLIAPFLGSLEQVIQFIQEFTGFLSPGVLVVFILGMFWKRAEANAALIVVLSSIPLSFLLKFLDSSEILPMPFLNRMALSFLILTTMMVGFSLFFNKKEEKNPVSDKVLRWIVLGSLVIISLPMGFDFITYDSGVPSGVEIFILSLSAILFAVILLEKKGDDPKAIQTDGSLFKTDTIFNITAVVIVAILTVLYWTLW